MTLTAAQVALRAGKLTASRIACLMSGDAQKILELWEQMIGERAEEDLSLVWPVQLGEVTEPLNLRWFELKFFPLSRFGDVVTHPRYAWAACTLDAWCSQLQCPVEVKHNNGWEPMEVIVERYQPQMQWQMEITGAKSCALSVILGAREPLVEFVNAEPKYQTEMIARGRQFMDHVEERTRPVDLPTIPPPVDATKLYDMTGKNEWASSAGVWLDTWQAAHDHDDAAAILKSLVPADAKKAHGHGVRITRDKVGRLSLREGAE